MFRSGRGARAAPAFLAALLLGASGVTGCASAPGDENPPTETSRYDPYWYLGDQPYQDDLDAIAGQRLYPDGPPNDVSLLDVEPPWRPPLPTTE